MTTAAGKLRSRISKARALIYRTAFEAAGRVGACDIRDTVVISGPPRSGTTLVQEVLQELPGYKTLNEPLIRREVQRRHGFISRTYLRPGDPAPQQRPFIEASLNGRLGPEAKWVYSTREDWSNLREHARRRKLLVKFCRLNRMLPWFIGEFETRGIVLVIRHPCSVVSSMIKFGQWDRRYVDQYKRPGSPLAVEHLPERTREVFEPIVSNLRSHAEALAAIWALDWFIPLMESERRPWVLLPYERMLRDERGDLDRVADALGFEISDSMIRLLRKPSSSVKGKLEADADAQLAKWKRNLAKNDIEAILKVVDAAGLSSLYNEAIDPDYDALNDYQDPRFRWN